MKFWYCPNCHRKKDTEDIVLLVHCGCGEAMVRLNEVKNGAAAD